MKIIGEENIRLESTTYTFCLGNGTSEIIMRQGVNIIGLTEPVKFRAVSLVVCLEETARTV